MELHPVDLVAALRRSGPDRATVGPAGRSPSARPGPSRSMGDATSLRQVVDNLLGNVRAHTPEGTTARVSVEPTATARSSVVADDGPGNGTRTRGPRLRTLLPLRSAAPGSTAARDSASRSCGPSSPPTAGRSRPRSNGGRGNDTFTVRTSRGTAGRGGCPPAQRHHHGCQPRSVAETGDASRRTKLTGEAHRFNNRWATQLKLSIERRNRGEAERWRHEPPNLPPAATTRLDVHGLRHPGADTPGGVMGGSPAGDRRARLQRGAAAGRQHHHAPVLPRPVLSR